MSYRSARNNGVESAVRRATITAMGERNEPQDYEGRLVALLQRLDATCLQWKARGSEGATYAGQLAERLRPPVGNAHQELRELLQRLERLDKPWRQTGDTGNAYANELHAAIKGRRGIKLSAKISRRADER